MTGLPDGIGQLIALKELYIHDNPALGVPTEILGPRSKDVNRYKVPEDQRPALRIQKQSKPIRVFRVLRLFRVCGKIGCGENALLTGEERDMTVLMNGSTESYSLPIGEAQRARESSAAIADFVRGAAQQITLRLEDGMSGRHIEATLSVPILQLLTQALAQMADGHSIALMPLDAELSTQQAADLMGVSRPYFVKLLEQGLIPFRRVGSQRRVRFDSLHRYMDEYQREAARAMEAMTTEAQQMGLYE